MGVVKTVRVDNVQKLQDIILQLKMRSVKIGIFGEAGSHILMIATVNEFGCDIYPKNAKWLTIPVSKQSKGRSARSFDGLFFMKDKKGEAWLCRNKGAHEFEFLYLLSKHVRIPERSFFRGGIDSNQSRIQSFIKKQLDKVFAFKLTVEQFYKSIGEYVVGLLQKYMTDLKEPPKSPITLATNPNKNNPLIQTGQLRNSITYKIE